MAKLRINFMGMRTIFLIVSAILLTVSIGSMVIRGFHFSIDFKGGSSITIIDGKGKTETEVLNAFTKAGMPDVGVQTIKTDKTSGFMVSTTQADEAKANAVADVAAKELGIDEFSVSVVGAGWGKQVTNSAVLAFSLSIIAILIYISIRFEYKMSVMAVVALFHDLVITMGIYSLFGQEVSPATIAALLTILGYSLYDTVVVFGRIKENSNSLVKTTFMDMANLSINEVFVRSINTTVTSLLPVVTMLFFNVESLNGFAVALTIGMLVGAYSSIGVAAPIYAMWKETEPKYAALRKKYSE